jgi:FAD/FMN-containing dehydrogenase/Fe-S oxidoreductase
MGSSATRPSGYELSRALRRAGLDPVETSSRRRAEYSSDASNYRVLPQAVVFPRSSEEIVAVHTVCAELSVPITMRGAGTSVAGNAIGPGVVVDCSRHLNRLLAVDPEARTAQVQPGVILDDLQRQLAPHGLRFGPEPSTHSRATLGGMIGNNACGSRALRYGRTSDNVRALDILTGAGERLPLGPGTDRSGSPTLTALHDLVGGSLAPIRQEFGRFSRQGSGLSLDRLLPEKGFDVPGLIAGSEGTLAIVLEATVELVHTPNFVTLLVLGYDDLPSAADDVGAILPFRPVAIEGMDSRIAGIVRAQSSNRVPDLPDGRAWLFVELAASSEEELAETARQVAAAVAATSCRPVTDPAEAADLWRIREDGAGLANRPVGTHAWHAGWEDAAVPVRHLGEYLRRFDSLTEEHGLVGYPYGHMGDGCVHVRLDFSLDSRPGVDRFRRFLDEAAHLVAGYGGSMSGEHGDGRARSELLPRMYSDTAISLFRAVKELFDPANLLNPGVIVTPAPLDADLRLQPGWRAPVPLGFAHDPDAGDFARAVHRCSGVGRCRSTTLAGDDVMCPSYLATRDEKDSTRGRARVLQELVRSHSRLTWDSPEVLEALDLCLACKGCASDCPTGTDMARYKSEVLHQAYRRRIRPASHYSLGRLPTWARLASKAPGAANLALSSRATRMFRRMAGVAEDRVLPRFAPRTFSDLTRRSGRREGSTPVLLWVDTFTEHFQPEVGLTAAKVLSAAGYDVRTPERRLCCGLTYVSTGQLNKARKLLRRTVAALSAAEDAGLVIVGLEPSCVATLRGDARELLGAETPVPKVHTLTEILSRHDTFRPDLAGTSILAQPHCHHRAVLGWDADRDYLQGLGAVVETVTGCCGLAGNFGMEAPHFDVSMQIAETALAPALRRADAHGVVLADGFSCRLQVRQLGGPPARHLAQLLADRIRDDEPQAERWDP